jgi:hypothetical protein
MEIKNGEVDFRANRTGFVMPFKAYDSQGFVALGHLSFTPEQLDQFILKVLEVTGEFGLTPGSVPVTVQAAPAARNPRCRLDHMGPCRHPEEAEEALNKHRAPGQYICLEHFSGRVVCLGCHNCARLNGQVLE